MSTSWITQSKATPSFAPPRGERSTSRCFHSSMTAVSEGVMENCVGKSLARNVRR